MVLELVVIPLKILVKGVENTSSTGSAEDNRLIIGNGIYSGNNNRGIIIDKNMSIHSFKYLGLSAQDTIINGENLNKIFNISPGPSVNFYGIIFMNGNASGSGGAIYAISLYPYVQYSLIPHLYIANCTFNNNSGARGAVASTFHTTIINSNFYNHDATEGGAIFIANSNFNFTRLTFYNNSASLSGSCIYFYTSDINSKGNVSYCIFGNNSNTCISIHENNSIKVNTGSRTNIKNFI